MGEIADAIIDGEFDYRTGEYIGPGCGYPRSFNDRTNDPVFGVTNYLMKQKFRAKSEHMEIIKGFFEKAETYGKTKKDLCIEIQKDFGKFAKYVKKVNIKKT